MSDCFDHAGAAWDQWCSDDYDRDHGTPWVQPYRGRLMLQRLGAVCRLCKKPGLWSFQDGRWTLVHSCDGPPVATLADFEDLS